MGSRIVYMLCTITFINFAKGLFPVWAKHTVGILLFTNMCNGWKVWSKWTTSEPKSIPRLVLDKVKQVLVTEVLNSNFFVQNVPNKSLSQEINKFWQVSDKFLTKCEGEKKRGGSESVTILTLVLLGEERKILLCAQACNIDILLIEWMLPFWLPLWDQYSLLL